MCEKAAMLVRSEISWKISRFLFFLFILKKIHGPISGHNYFDTSDKTSWINTLSVQKLKKEKKNYLLHEIFKNYEIHLTYPLPISLLLTLR